MTIVATHRYPFAIEPNVVRFQPGLSLQAMASEIPTLPEGWPRHEHDCIAVNGTIIPRGHWPMIKPKDGVEVQFHAPAMGGGGGGGGKQILSLVASVALIALSGGIASGGILGGLTGATAGQATLFSRLLGSAVLIGGSALVSSFASAPTVPLAQNPGSTQNPIGTSSASGNRLEPNTPLPRVVGSRKVFPPFLTEPLVYYDNQDEVVEAVMGLGGPHQLTDIRVDGAEIESMVGVEFETREGWAGRSPLQTVTRYARTTAARSELRGHVVRTEAPTNLDVRDDNIDDALPQPKILTTRGGPDEYWIDIQFPQGLFFSDTPEDLLRVPFRLRMREKGTTTWINLPEIHFAEAHVGEKRASIHIVWRDGDLVAASAEPQRGWVEGRIVSPGQEVEPTTTDRVAHSSFDQGSGEDYVISTNAQTTAVQNLILNDTLATIFINESLFPRGRYEIEVERGYAILESNYDAVAYTISDSVRDPFFYEGGNPTISETKESLSDVVYVNRGISVWNDQPIQTGGIALIALRARNTAISNVTTVAAGYVKDWDGSGWNTWTTTSNPAPHYRDALGGQLNALPVPDDLIDDTGLMEWRTACDSLGYTVNAVLEGLSVFETKRLIAGAGYAQPYQSDLFGVVRDRDRSAEGPVQIFSPRNSANFKWAKGFPPRLDGYRITFNDAEEDYEPRQIIHPEGAEMTEQVEFSALVTEADVRQRADYDLNTQDFRGVFYDWDAPSEAIKCRRGDLVQMNHDMLSEQHASGRIIDVELDAAGLVTAILVNEDMPALDFLDWDEIEPDDWETLDMGTIGFSAGVILRGDSISTHTATTDGPVITLDTPVAIAGLEFDDLAIVGPAQNEGVRLLVRDMRPRDDLTWTITAVDEAPEIWNGE